MTLNLPTYEPGNLSQITPLILGGATFNVQYNDNPFELEIKNLLLESFENGINAIDTSPYYGPSEQLLGNALKELLDSGLIQRENYFICTKVGRVQLDEFDYSAKWVNASIRRSLERLHTDYLDVVYLHDIEFVNEEGIIEALTELMSLKKQGFIKNVGISGYPVDWLYQIATKVTTIPEIGKLDAVLSYCNMCLQNSILLDYYEKFLKDAGIKLLNNASILSMSLLRSAETRSFHPCSDDLKSKVDELAKILKTEHNVELAELSTRYAIRLWLNKKGKTVLGLSNVRELESALVQYKHILDKDLDEQDAKLVNFSQEFLGEHFNETWASGIPH